jgi:hypothetical protein
VPSNFCTNCVAIFGVMAQEADLAPVDLVFDYTAQQFESFIAEK